MIDAQPAAAIAVGTARAADLHAAQRVLRRRGARGAVVVVMRVASTACDRDQQYKRDAERHDFEHTPAARGIA